MNAVTFRSHEIHIKECNVTAGNSTANAIKVLASLEVMKNLEDNQRFNIVDDSIREYLKATDLVTANEDDSFTCTKEQRKSCEVVADTISKFIDDTIKVFHKDHPNGTISAED